MTARDFCYWLQGMFELTTGVTALDVRQTDLIKRHLAMVFLHDIDPAAGGPVQQAALNAAHQGPQQEPPRPPVLGGVGPGGIVYRC